MRTSSTRRIGICILNWNAGPVLARCIEAVISAVSERCHELVVVDNASSDDSIAILKQRCPDVAVIENATNVGFAAGNNVGARYLLDRGCSLLLFINPDVLLTKATVDQLIRALEDDSSAGCAGGYAGDGSCRNRPTAIQEIILYGPLKSLPFAKRLWSAHTAPQREVDGVCQTYAVGGACMLFRAQAFREIGGFDEATFLYAEEFIVAERLLSAGWHTVTVPTATFAHIGGHSSKKMFFRRRLHYIRSEHYLVTRYYGWSEVSAGLLAAYRYIEWLPYVGAAWLLGKGRTMVTRLGKCYGWL